jgi:hypothetical protein
MSTDPLCGEARMRALAPLVKRLESELRQPLDFGGRVLVVNTDDGYHPSLNELAAKIDRVYSRPRLHGLDQSRPDGSVPQERIRPLVGTPVPAVTRTWLTSATWLHDVPRI